MLKLKLELKNVKSECTCKACLWNSTKITYLWNYNMEWFEQFKLQELDLFDFEIKKTWFEQLKLYELILICETIRPKLQLSLKLISEF